MTNVISNEELDKKLAESPAERVTPEYMQSRIKYTDFINLDRNKTVTLCRITLDNGYSVSGESACVNPENYNKDIGEKVAYEDAFKKLWPLFGFLLAEKNFIN